MQPKEFGGLGEKIAQDYLRGKGYKILDKNFKRKWGEIDLVAKPPTTFLEKVVGGKKKNKIVFVEVKTIQLRKGFFPEDEIDQKKKQQLLKMAQIYLSTKKMPLDTPCQIDILAIEIPSDFKKAKIRHYENAVEDTH